MRISFVALLCVYAAVIVLLLFAYNFLEIKRDLKAWNYFLRHHWGMWFGFHFIADRHWDLNISFLLCFQFSVVFCSFSCLLKISATILKFILWNEAFQWSAEPDKVRQSHIQMWCWWLYCSNVRMQNQLMFRFVWLE